MVDNEPDLGHCLLFHRWTKWSNPKIVDAIVRSGSMAGTKVGNLLFQNRKCIRCNKIQSKEIKV